jgi:hypothetical protein
MTGSTRKAFRLRPGWQVRYQISGQCDVPGCKPSPTYEWTTIDKIIKHPNANPVTYEVWYTDDTAETMTGQQEVFCRNLSEVKND